MKKGVIHLPKISESIMVFIMAFSIAISSLSILNLTVNANSIDVWDGSTKATSFADGDGSEETPYKISTPEQLAYLVDTFTANYGANTGGKYFELTNDIYLNNVEDENWQTNAPNQWYSSTNSKLFTGIFDGKGYTVYGIYRNDTPSETEHTSGILGTGLIPQAGNSAEIHNVSVKESYISGVDYAGGIVGRVYKNAASTTVISGCSVDDTVTVKAWSAGGIIGGANKVNSTYLITVENCGYVGNANTLSGTYATVFTGVISNGYAKIKNSWFVSDKAATRNATLTNVYGTTAGTYSNTSVNVLTEAQMKGETAKTNMPNLDWNLWDVVEGGYPIFTVNSSGYDIWDGSTKATSFAGGDGTEESPYLISTPEQLAYLVDTFTANYGANTGGKYFELTNDIYLNDVSKSDWQSTANQWYSFSGSSKLFSGIFDGKGYTVYGIYRNDTPATADGNNATGLFPYVANAAEIRNVNVRKSYISGVNNAGGIVGRVYKNWDSTTVISGCSVDETVTVKAYSAGGIIGGANRVNSTYLITVENCWYVGNADTLSGTYATVFTGGISNGYATIKDSWFVSDKKAARDATFRNVYGTTDSGVHYYTSVTVLTEAQMKGEAAKTNMPALDWKKIWKVVENDFPQLNVIQFGGSVDGTPGEVWSGEIASKYADGDGTKENPFKIATGEQLAKAVKDTSSAGKYYELTHDILLNDVEKENWQSDEPNVWFNATSNGSNFKGNFEGNGHIIRGLYYNETPEVITYDYVERVGLFPVLGSGALVRNVGVEDSYMSSKGCVGTIAGYVHVSGTAAKYAMIEGCYAANSVTLQGLAVGGLVGATGKGVEIYNSYSLANLIGQGGRINGIIGDIWSNSSIIVNCYTVGQQIHRASYTPSTFSGVYSTVEQTGVTTLSEEQMKGQNAVTSMPEFDWQNVWQVNENGYPTLRIIPDDYNSTPFYEGVKGEVWSGRTSKYFAGGSGTEADPFLIETPEQLAKLVSTCISNTKETTDKYYKLTADIHLNDTSKENWKETAIQWYHTNVNNNAFRGVFDGDGHVVSGIYIDYNTAGYRYAGLFPSLMFNSVVKNVGVINTDITIVSERESHCAAISGYVFGWNIENNPGVASPKISQCFADTTVSITASYAGGIIGGLPRTVEIENCYFLGDLDGSYAASMIGNTWSNHIGSKIIGCYASTADKDDFTAGNAGSSPSPEEIICENSYNVGKTIPGVKYFSLPKIQGENAKKNMAGLDYDNVWMIVDGGTPILRIFGNEAYSDKRDPVDTVIRFATNGGEDLAAISGRPDTPLSLPTPVKEHHTFEGWYVFDELDIPFEMDSFPGFDLILYAKWSTDAVIQDFERYPNTMYDLGDDYLYYRPGSAGYSARFVHGGNKSIKRVGDSSKDSDFLVFYENELTVGKKYTLSFYITTDETSASATLSLIHSTWPDYYEPNVGIEKITSVEGLKSGDWKKITYSFVAKSRWISIRTTGDTTLYFDDFVFAPVG